MSFRIVFRRFWHGKGTFARIPALRRLTIESLEQRALLSVTATPFSSATQHMTVADLPVAAQQAITAKFTQEGKFTASSGMAANDFGFSVSVSGNTVVVGAPDTTVDSSTAQGAAYVFTESASGWANMNEIAKLTASDGVPGDDFGWSVSISGNTVVVGAPGTTVGYGSQYRGAAYVFTEPSTGWANMTQTAKLTASDAAVQDFFGWSVANSGNTVVVGTENETVGGNYAQGAAYVFAEHGSRWTNMTQTAKLITSHGAALDDFGASVSISGNTVVVGYFAHGTGQVAADVFAEPSSGWANMIQTAELKVSRTAGIFGGVSISGNTVVVGSYNLPPATPASAGAFPIAMPALPNTLSRQGAAYVFVEPASGWANMTQTATLLPSDDTAYGGLGAVISGNTVVIGEPGAAYVFTKPVSGWADMTQTAKLISSDGDQFVNALAIGGNTIVVGGGGGLVGGNGKPGAIYVFGMTTPTIPPTITLPPVKSVTVGPWWT